MSLVDRLRHVATAALSDVQGHGQVLDGIRSVTPGAFMAGPAFPVRCPPGSVVTVLRALELAPPGSVLVVGGEGFTGGAVLGELVARYAARRGLAGMVVDGAVRDTVGLRALGFPVCARAVTPRAWLNPDLGEAGVTIAAGGVTVRPGDWVVGDDDGVAVIPQEQLEQVVAAGEEKERQEQEIAARIDAGEALVDITGLRGRVGL